jgi:hypothetical protein
MDGFFVALFVRTSSTEKNKQCPQIATTLDTSVITVEEEDSKSSQQQRRKLKRKRKKERLALEKQN